MYFKIINLMHDIFAWHGVYGMAHFSWPIFNVNYNDYYLFVFALVANNYLTKRTIQARAILTMNSSLTV